MNLQPRYWWSRLALRLSIRYGSKRDRRALIDRALWTIASLILLLLAYIIVEWNDQRTEWRLKVQAERKQATLYETMLLDCFNGKAPGLYYINEKGERVYIACDKAWYLNVGKVS